MSQPTIIASTSAEPRNKPRIAYLDFLRVLACFLVIVNHTNSPIFLSIPPTGLTWYLSITYHFISKMDISLFLLISGACLLGRVDSYTTLFRRELRILGLLLVFSLLQFFLTAPYSQGWGAVMAAALPFLLSLWKTPAVGAYWYLYLYLGMLLMLPFLQRMVRGMTSNRDFRLFFTVWLVFGNGLFWLSHYVPNAEPSSYFSLPLFTDTIGLLLAGYYVHHRMSVSRKTVFLAAVIWAFSILAQVVLSRLEYDVTGGKITYLFLDWRIKPSLFMISSSISAMYLAKACYAKLRKPILPRLIRELSACTLFVYVTHHLVQNATRTPIYLTLAERITALPAVFIWELVIFLTCLLAAIPLRRLPVLRKLL